MIYIFPLHAHKSTGTMSSAAWPTTEQKKLVLQNTLKFIDEHHVPMSRYITPLHTITVLKTIQKSCWFI